MVTNKLVIDLLSTGSGGALKFAKAITLHRNLFEMEVILIVTEDLSDRIDISEHDLVFDNNFAGIGRFIYSRRITKCLKKTFGDYYLLNPYQVGLKYGAKKMISVLRNMEPFLHHRYQYGIKQRSRNWMLYHMTLQTFRRSDSVISISKCTKRFLAEKNIDSRLIPHGFDITETPKRSQYSADILVVGSILPYRRIEDVLAGISKLEGHHGVKRHLTIIGETVDSQYYKRLVSLSKRLEIYDRVSFLGKVKYEEVLGYMSKCTIFLNPSEIEACPNVAIESMMVCKYIIAVRNTALEEVYTDHVSYYDERDITAMAKAILNPTENSQEDIPNWTWEKCMKRYNKIISNELLRN